MTLKDFHKVIEEKIHLRGKTLFEDGKVKKLHLDEHTWHATVSGSIDYQVDISIENYEILKTSCTCPYNNGPICKHQIAVLYAIKKKLDIKDHISKTGSKQRIKSTPISIKERNSMLFLKYGRLDVQDGAFVLVDEKGVRVHIPIGGIACLFLEPGTTITHAAVSLASDVGTLLVWVGESGVRLYSAGQPGGARSDKLLYQARLALEEPLRLKVVRAMYKFRFGEEPPQRRSIDQLRGIEGARVRNLYELMAKKYNVPWKRRKYDPKNWDSADNINRTLSAANHALYGICEAAILAADYAPAIGFIHTGKPQSFVYDIGDLFKFDTVVPIAFHVVASGSTNPVRDVRLQCRNMFKESKLLKTIIPTIEEILSAGEIQPPAPSLEAMPVAIPNEEGIGDAGHRN